MGFSIDRLKGRPIGIVVFSILDFVVTITSFWNKEIADVNGSFNPPGFPLSPI
jgi:hypothetical protein